MREFGSPAGLAAFLRAAAAKLPEAEKHGLEQGAKLIETEAKAEIGHYQEAAGPFAAWPELSDRTKADRAAHGFAADEPLLRTGELRTSIEHHVEGNKAVIGSASEIAVYQELGTPNAAHPIPPGAFLGSSAYRMAEQAAKAIGMAVANVLAGKPPGAD